MQHDISDERRLQEVLEQRALIDLVDHLRRQATHGVWVAVGKESLRLEEQPAGTVVEAVGLAPEVARLVLAARPARAAIVAPGHRPGAVRGEALDLVPQQLGVAAALIGVGVGRADAGLGQQPQGAHGVATVGAEPGEVDECRSVAAPAVDGGLQRVDGRGRVARAVQEPGPQPDRTDRRIGPRQHAGESHEIVELRPSAAELPPHRRRDVAVVERIRCRVHRDGLTVGGDHGVIGIEEPSHVSRLSCVEAVEDGEPVARLPRPQRVPVEAILGDGRIPLYETGRRVQVGQRRDRIVDERPPVGEQCLVDRAFA